MRKYLVWAVVVGMALAWTGWAQERAASGRGEPQAKSNERQNIELAHQQLELKARSDELAFQKKLRAIQLEKQDLELEQQRAAIRLKPEQPPVKGMKSSCKVGGKTGCPMARHCARIVALGMALCLVLHILLAIWVYQDIRKRNTGSGIWIVITLLAGLVGAALYALVRIGDKPTT